MDNEPLDYEEFINSLDDYVPIIPDEVINYYLNRTGFSCTDDKMKRLISLATQKFISDVTNDSLQYCKIRLQGGSREKVKGKEKTLVLSLEDLSPALKEYGIDIRKPDYFAENIPQELTTTTTGGASSLLSNTNATTTSTTTTSTTSTSTTSTAATATSNTTTTTAATSTTTTTDSSTTSTTSADQTTNNEDNDSPPKKQKVK